MPLLDLIWKREPNKRARGSAVSKTHEGRKGFLQLHDSGASEVTPKCIHLSGGKRSEMRTNFRNIRGQKREMFGYAFAEFFDFFSICSEVRERKLLSLILELKLRISASE